jgi:hypothetical protein
MGGIQGELAYYGRPMYFTTDTSFNGINSVRYGENSGLLKFIFSNATQFNDNRYAFPNQEDFSIIITDTTGFENCVSEITEGYSFNEDTTFISRDIYLNIDSGIQFNSLNIVDSIFVINECNCDSFPVADFVFSILNNTVYFSESSVNAISYFWNFGDGQTSSLQNPTHFYSDSVFHTITLSVTNDCGNDIYSYTITAQDTLLEISLNEHHFLIKMYPIPTEDVLNIDIEEKLTSELNIVDLQGKILLKRILNSNKNIVDISALKKGFYISKVITDDEVFQIKIIKN